MAQKSPGKLLVAMEKVAQLGQTKAETQPEGACHRAPRTTRRLGRCTGHRHRGSPRCHQAGPHSDSARDFWAGQANSLELSSLWEPVCLIAAIRQTVL